MTWIDNFIHISIDDAIESFELAYTNKPDSLFDIEFFSDLKKWHERYGLSFDLYVFERKNGFRLDMLDEVYWDELKGTSAWLKLGWHQVEPGIIALSVSEQRTSISRIYELIVNKCSEMAWSKTVRLHYYEANRLVLEDLFKLGVRELLTADSEERVSYDLSSDESKIVYAEGIYRRSAEAVSYKRTDLRLDNIGSEMPVAEAVRKLESFVNRQMAHRCIELFFHERFHKKVASLIDILIAGIFTINKKLYINAAYSINGDVYFSTVNTDYIWKINSDSKKIYRVSECSSRRISKKYSSYIIYNSEHYLIPFCETDIFFYDASNRIASSISLPYDDDIDPVNNPHRKAVVYDKYLWILPVRVRALVRIDMDTKSIKMFDSFPDGVSFEKGRMNFKCMSLLDEYIYLFADGCSDSLKVNAKTGKMEKLNVCFNGRFGTIVYEDMVLLSPMKDGDPLVFYNLNTSVSSEIELPSWVWSGSKKYAFWYSHRIDDYVFVLPHEANAILRVDVNDFSVKAIRIPNRIDNSLSSISMFSAYDVFSVEKEYWVTEFGGNRIIRIDQSGNVIGIIDLYTNWIETISHKSSTRNLFNKNFNNDLVISEKDNGYLAEFIDFINEDTVVEKRPFFLH